MTDKKTIFVGSVSGNFFVWQMAAMVNLERNYFLKTGTYLEPNLCMGSSGGSISLGLAIGCVWNPEHMVDRIKNIDSRDLFKSHDHVTNFPLFSCMRFGTIYRTVDNINLLTEKFLPIPSTLKDVQLIIGTFCKEDQKPRYFTNSIREITSENMVVLDSHHDLIRSMVASCSIPLIMPQVTLQDKKYQDGGLYSASPIHDFSQNIMKMKQKIQLIYFGARKDPHKTDIPIVSELVNFLNSNYIKDVEIAQTILASRLRRTVKNNSGASIQELIEFLVGADEFVAVIYPAPENSNSFSMTEFTGPELSKIIDTFNDFHIEIYH